MEKCVIFAIEKKIQIDLLLKEALLFKHTFSNLI